MDCITVVGSIYERTSYISEFSKKHRIAIMTSPSYDTMSSFIESLVFPEGVNVVPLKDYPGIDVDRIGDYADRAVAIYPSDDKPQSHNKDKYLTFTVKNILTDRNMKDHECK